MDALKSTIFAFQSEKPTLQTSFYTSVTIYSFRDPVLVCKMHDCYRTIRKNFERFIPSHQAMQAIAMVGLSENKPLQNCIKHYIYLYNILYYANCIIYRLFYC